MERTITEHMNDRLEDLAYMLGLKSEKATLAWLEANGYDDNRGTVYETAYELFCSYGLELTEHREGDESEDRQGLTTYNFGDKSTWYKAIHRVPARYRRGYRIFEYLLSTGGPEDGFLIIYGYNSVVAAYYWEADWGTFERKKCTPAQMRILERVLDPLEPSFEFRR